MAEPTFDQAAEDLSYLTDALDHLEQATADGTTGWVKLEEDYRNQVRGRLAQSSLARIKQAGARLATILSLATVRRLAEPHLRQMALAFDSSIKDNAPMGLVWQTVYQGMVDNSKTFNSPGDTYAAFSTNGNIVTAAGTFVGTGDVDRLTVDENGFSLEGWVPDTYKLTCVADGRSRGVQTHRERFDLTGTAAFPNNLKEDGSGLSARGILGITATETKKLIRNPSFSEYTQPASTLTDLPGWTNGATIGTNLEIDTTNTFRSEPGTSSDASLKFNASDSIYPKEGERVSPKYDPTLPYTHSIKVRRNSTATGTVTLRLSGTIGSGGISASVSLASITADTWATLKIAVGTNSWPSNFNENDLLLQIEVTLTSGTCNVDDINAGAMKRVGKGQSVLNGAGGMGQYIQINGGATPFLRGDQFQAADTPGGSRGVIHKQITRTAEWGYLPSNNAGAETTADR